jgi:hypothetical protein
VNCLERLNPLEFQEHVLKVLKEMDRRDGSEDNFITWSYTPDPRISEYLHQLKNFLEIKQPSQQLRKEAGYLLEKILVVAFKGLAGYSEIKSYRSGSFQLDLLISGDDTKWQAICDRIHQTNECERGIIVEAKAEKTAVSSAQFSRFCNILAANFCNTVGLGIFFTLEGASGFPKKGGSRKTSFRDARLCQIIFYAKTNKKIIVLDKNDIFELAKSGSLTRILIRKVKEIEEASGLPTASPENLVDEDLPSYLKDII